MHILPKLSTQHFSEKGFKFVQIKSFAKLKGGRDYLKRKKNFIDIFLFLFFFNLNYYLTDEIETYVEFSLSCRVYSSFFQFMIARVGEGRATFHIRVNITLDYIKKTIKKILEN